MTTWNAITVTGVQAAGITLESLPDLNLYEGEKWANGSTYNEPAEPGKHGTWSEDPDSFVCTGSSKYTADGVPEWAAEITSGLADVIVEWFEEWDDDGGGKSVTIYRNGAVDLDASQVSALIPSKYAELEEQGKEALAALDSATIPEGNRYASQQEAARAAAEVLRRLIEGINIV